MDERKAFSVIINSSIDTKSLMSSNYNNPISTATAAATDASAPPVVSSFPQQRKRRVPLKRPPFRLPSTLVFGRTPVTRFYKVPFPVAGVNTTEPMDEAMFAEVTHGPTDPESTILVEPSERLTRTATFVRSLHDETTMQTIEEGRVGVIEGPKLSREEQFLCWYFEQGCPRSNSKPEANKAMRFFCVMLALAGLAVAFAFTCGKATQSAALNLHGEMQLSVSTIVCGNETAQQAVGVAPLPFVGTFHDDIALNALKENDEGKAIVLFKSGSVDVSRELFHLFLSQPRFTLELKQEDRTKALVPYLGGAISTLASTALVVFQSQADASLGRFFLAKPRFTFGIGKDSFYSQQPLLMIAAPPSDHFESDTSAAPPSDHSESNTSAVAVQHQGWSQLMVHGEGYSLGAAKVHFDFTEDETNGVKVRIDCSYEEGVDASGLFTSDTVSLADVTLFRSHDPFAGRELLTVGFGKGRFSVTVVCTNEPSPSKASAPGKGANASPRSLHMSDLRSGWRLYHVLSALWVVLHFIGKRGRRRRFLNNRRRRALRQLRSQSKSCLNQAVEDDKLAKDKADLEVQRCTEADLEEQQRHTEADWEEQQRRNKADLEVQQRRSEADLEVQQRRNNADLEVQQRHTEADLEEQRRNNADLEDQQRSSEAGLEDQQRSSEAGLEDQQQHTEADSEFQQRNSEAQRKRCVHWAETVSVRSFDRTVGCRMRVDLTDGRPPEPKGYPLGLDWTFVDSQADLGMFGHECSRQNHSTYRVHSGIARRQILLDHGLDLREIESMNSADRMSFLADLDAFFAMAHGADNEADY
ncbi:hypothetical protein MPSEU_000574100 [Mayamaea pseudoterrestris]|nr:hypothetical protein MPSEU_000574100 [Mayamaea pseudoterrestris]